MPADAERLRPRRARLVQGAMRSAGPCRHHRRHGQHVRPPPRHKPPRHKPQRPAADRHGLAPRHAADRRQVRRRARRPGRARSHAHAGRGRLRDPRPHRDRQLDQRGRCALCTPDARVGRLCRRVLPRLCLCAHRPRRQDIRRRARAHRLSRRNAGRRAHILRDVRTAYRARPDPGGSRQKHRHRARRARRALVRGDGNGPGSPHRRHADAAAQERARSAQPA